MIVVTMVFAVLGFLSPANRGGLITAGVVLYVVMGVFAGYFATRTYKMFKGQNWKRTTVMV
jgi:transmembrane 9 superfamily protein 2/4